jgi:hypothetical protein
MPAVFVALSRFTIANGMEEEVKAAFRARPHGVDHAPGFVRMEVLCPFDRPQEIWLITHWRCPLARDYMHALLGGFRQVAGRLVFDALEGGELPGEIYLQVFATRPARGGAPVADEEGHRRAGALLQRRHAGRDVAAAPAGV